MASKKYEGKSAEELESIGADLDKEIDKLKDERRAVRAAMDEALEDEAASRLVSTMSPGQVNAVARAARATSRAAAIEPSGAETEPEPVH